MAAINSTFGPCECYSQGWSPVIASVITTLVVNAVWHVFCSCRRRASPPVQALPIRPEVIAAPLKPLASSAMTTQVFAPETEVTLETLRARMHARKKAEASSGTEDVKEVSSPYEKLTCPAAYQKLAFEIFTYLANNSFASMVWNLTATMETLGTKGKAMETMNVHPLKLIELIVKDDKIKPAMIKVFADKSKRENFIDPGIVKKALKAYGLSGGIKDKLDEKKAKGDLDQYIDGFAKAVGVTRAQIQQYFTKSNWEGLITFLLSR